jgi:hypothetical protein
VTIEGAPEGEFTGHEEVELLRQLVEGQHHESDLLTQVISLLGDTVGLLGTISTNLSTFLTEWTAANTEPSHPAVRGVLKVTGGNMPGQLTVDQDGNAVVGFVDNFNNPTGLPAGDGSGLTMTVTGDDNGSLVTPGAYSEGTDSVTGQPVAVVALAPVGPVGVSNLTAVLENVSGAPLTEADGVTAFPAIAPFALTLVAGPAAAGELSVDAAPGV